MRIYKRLTDEQRLANRRASEMRYLLKPERVCPKCGVLKTVDDFRRKPRSRPNSYCRDCLRGKRATPEWRAYHLAYHKRFAERINARRKITDAAYRDLRRKLVDDAKAGPCADCGIRYPAFVMDFDHRDPKTKKFAIARAPRQHCKIEDIEAGIAKCDAVCANCHRYRTNMQLRSKYPHLVNGRA